MHGRGSFAPLKKATRNSALGKLIIKKCLKTTNRTCETFNGKTLKKNLLRDRRNIKQKMLTSKQNLEKIIPSNSERKNIERPQIMNRKISNKILIPDESRNGVICRNFFFLFIQHIAADAYFSDCGKTKRIPRHAYFAQWTGHCCRREGGIQKTI